MTTKKLFAVVICGGGTAGTEALLRLRRLAGDSVEMTLLCPQEQLFYRPDAVLQPFTLGGGLGGSHISAPIEAPHHLAQDLEADAAALATRVVDQTISDAVEHDAGSTQQSVKITRAAVRGHGAKVLLDEVTESDLLIVGSRGHDGFAGALLGSVSHHVVAQAPCPVVVVPDRQSEATQ